MKVLGVVMCAIVLAGEGFKDLYYWNIHWETSYLHPCGSGTGCWLMINIKSKETYSNINWLSPIEYSTTLNKIIDISLPRIDQDEECIIRPPGESYTKSSRLVREGVQVHNRSRFVSCRITIGPMVEELIGDWYVCGKLSGNNKEPMRCQSAKIRWFKPGHPDVDWYKNYQKPDQEVYLNSTLTLPLRTFIGDVVACHIITPAGEDLLISPQESQYPFIKATYADSVCNFTIGPPNKDLLGHWVVYGLFESLTQGFIEERRSIELILDEKKPNPDFRNSTEINDFNLSPLDARNPVLDSKTISIIDLGLVTLENHKKIVNNKKDVLLPINVHVRDSTKYKITNVSAASNNNIGSFYTISRKEKRAPEFSVNYLTTEDIILYVFLSLAVVCVIVWLFRMYSDRESKSQTDPAAHIELAGLKSPRSF